MSNYEDLSAAITDIESAIAEAHNCDLDQARKQALPGMTAVAALDKVFELLTEAEVGTQFTRHDLAAVLREELAEPDDE
ncbi:hypothetical protein [Actinopolyspora halophila]|uniref:hypothetical protein n=1 Tax=Actinopolyspora halophila TaxID=1850 RepID=UPI000369DAB6|nr:hypothetical protein [Actinopolyspora halophila]